MDNESVAVARGDFIVWCDSDDFFRPEALETLIKAWESIPAEAQHEFCGVSALCDTEDGVLGNPFSSPRETVDLIWNDLYCRLNSDFVIFTRAELLKENPFLEVDFLISESSVWNKVGVLKTRFLPLVLERKRYGEANALSYSGHMSYNRGHAYAMASARSYSAQYLGTAERLRRAVNYIRYCRHGEVPLLDAFRLFRAGYSDIFLLILVIPVSEVLVIKDRLQGKVRKTHRDFLAAQAIVKIEVERLNF
jgi:hypothetical protein